MFGWGPWGFEPELSEDEIEKRTAPDPWDDIRRQICGEEKPEVVWQRFAHGHSCATSPASSDDVRELEERAKWEEAALAAFMPGANPGLPKEERVAAVTPFASWLALRWRALLPEVGCLREVGEVVLTQATGSSSARASRR
mmetsp:Transcript_10529/g.23973  ORF Transcript_10529/g.23973 Transcript_10529/m.23973 type:complete len:141 (+) Transcript_10529:69-491(+)